MLSSHASPRSPRAHRFQGLPLSPLATTTEALLSDIDAAINDLAVEAEDMRSPLDRPAALSTAAPPSPIESRRVLESQGHPRPSRRPYIGPVVSSIIGSGDYWGYLQRARPHSDPIVTHKLFFLLQNYTLYVYKQYHPNVSAIDHMELTAFSTAEVGHAGLWVVDLSEDGRPEPLTPLSPRFERLPSKRIWSLHCTNRDEMLAWLEVFRSAISRLQNGAEPIRHPSPQPSPQPSLALGRSRSLSDRPRARDSQSPHSPQSPSRPPLPDMLRHPSNTSDSLEAFRVGGARRPSNASTDLSSGGDPATPVRRTPPLGSLDARGHRRTGSSASNSGAYSTMRSVPGAAFPVSPAMAEGLPHPGGSPASSFSGSVQVPTMAGSYTESNTHMDHVRNSVQPRPQRGSSLDIPRPGVPVDIQDGRRLQQVRIKDNIFAGKSRTTTKPPMISILNMTSLTTGAL
ncbi:uncharacterized protein BJ171DRAFT_499438 [Polychytrium aggregatum]|uniref:uncharacterized protein n=1 Tax=Polychytrium aggregatum TaxID=110093 RepID=UPI0022FDD1FB|nr:uncharacterized protein BJ171DRAFT_499438 [Polychytrium aggregatum]KAI9205718.1 hypothetical protein BJ171DRAFT_499438 [Polychytrium aggregatum]